MYLARFLTAEIHKSIKMTDFKFVIFRKLGKHADAFGKINIDF